MLRELGHLSRVENFEIAQLIQVLAQAGLYEIVLYDDCQIRRIFVLERDTSIGAPVPNMHVMNVAVSMLLNKIKAFQIFLQESMIYSAFLVIVKKMKKFLTSEKIDCVVTQSVASVTKHFRTHVCFFLRR